MVTYPPTFTIQLVGGPDDGASFETVNLPTFWEMLSENVCDACLRNGYYTPIDSERYWRSTKLTSTGQHIYYHEGTINLEAVIS